MPSSEHCCANGARGGGSLTKTGELTTDGLTALRMAKAGTDGFFQRHAITTVDAAWNPEWVGTEQTRFFKIEGDRLEVVSQWRVMPNWPEKGMQRSILIWEKVK